MLTTLWKTWTILFQIMLGLTILILSTFVFNIFLGLWLAHLFTNMPELPILLTGLLTFLYSGICVGLIWNLFDADSGLDTRSWKGVAFYFGALICLGTPMLLHYNGWGYLLGIVLGISLPALFWGWMKERFHIAP